MQANTIFHARPRYNHQSSADTLHQPAEPGRALQAVCRLASADSAQLLEVDQWAGTATVTAQTGFSVPELAPPVILAAIPDDMGTAFASPYPHWLSGTGDDEAGLIIKISDQGPNRVFLALLFASADEAVRARVERIISDVIVLLKITVEQKRRERDLEHRYAAMFAALNDGECGVIAIRADQSLVFANTAAYTLLAADSGLHVTRGVLRPTHYADVARFQAALDSVTQAAQPSGSANRPALIMMLKGEGKRRPKVVVITPAAQEDRLTPSDLAARALIYVLEPGARQETGIVALCRLHGMSKVEARLACHLCDGLTLHESAAEMRIKLETARAYLKQVFVKTETHRQAELVTLLTRYVRAIRGNYDFQIA